MSGAGPQVNGLASPTGKYIDHIDPDDPEYIKNLQRPAEVKEDLQQMENRSRVKVILNSQAFKDELEQVVEEQLRNGPFPTSLIALQQITDLLLPHSKGGLGSLARASAVIPINDLRGVESQNFVKGERLLRCKLAALYRLVDLCGWSHGIYNHISARVSSESEHFLLNPFGLTYSEVTASTLIKVDINGEIVDPGSTYLGPYKAGFLIHAAIHQARPDIRCIVHSHTPAAVAVSALKCGLIPMSQEALLCGNISYHDFQGISMDSDERDKLARNLGVHNKIQDNSLKTSCMKQVLILRNRGVLSCGETVEEAFHYTFNVMAACEAQVKAIPLGLDNIVILSEEDREAHKTASQGAVDSKERKWKTGELEFEALMRTLDNSGYRTGYPYKMPVVKQERKERSNSEVEIPPSSSSFTYIFDGDYVHSKYASPLQAAKDRQKIAFKAGWLTTPNAYKKTEIDEIGTTTPKKITKWVSEGDSPGKPAAIKIENPNQFAPQGDNPKEYRNKQKSIKKDYYEEKVTAGPQSRILEGITWDEAQKAKDGHVSGTGDQVIVVGAASKGIIQRDHQHNAVVYRQYYAANPFENMSEAEMEQYQSEVQRKERGEPEVEEEIQQPPIVIEIPTIEPPQEPERQETEVVEPARPEWDTNGLPERAAASSQPSTGHHTPIQEKLQTSTLDQMGQTLCSDILDVQEQNLEHQILTGTDPMLSQPHVTNLVGDHCIESNLTCLEEHLSNNAPAVVESCGSDEEYIHNNSHITSTDDFRHSENFSWSKRFEAENGETSSSEDDFVRIQLNPIQLYHGQRESGVMKVRFSVQSTVRRLIRSEHSRGGDCTIEEVCSSISEPFIEHFPADDHSFQQSVGLVAYINKVNVKRSWRRERQPTVDSEQSVQPHSAASNSDVYGNEGGRCSNQSHSELNISPDMIGGNLSHSELNISPDMIGGNYPDRTNDASSSVNPGIECAGAPTDTVIDTGQIIRLNIRQEEKGKQTPNYTQASGEEGRRTGQLVKDTSSASKTVQSDKPARNSEMSRNNTSINSLGPGRWDESWKKDTVVLPVHPYDGILEEDIKYADDELDEYFDPAKDQPEENLKPDEGHAQVNTTISSKKRLLDRKRMPPPPLPPLIKSKNSKSKKMSLRQKIKQTYPPLSPVKEEFGGTVEEMEEMEAILEEIDDSFEQLLISAEDDLLISPSTDPDINYRRLAVTGGVGAAPMAMEDDFDPHSSNIPARYTDMLLPSGGIIGHDQIDRNNLSLPTDIDAAVTLSQFEQELEFSETTRSLLEDDTPVCSSDDTPRCSSDEQEESNSAHSIDSQGESEDEYSGEEDDKPTNPLKLSPSLAPVSYPEAKFTPGTSCPTNSVFQENLAKSNTVMTTAVEDLNRDGNSDLSSGLEREVIEGIHQSEIPCIRVHCSIPPRRKEPDKSTAVVEEGEIVEVDPRHSVANTGALPPRISGTHQWYMPSMAKQTSFDDTIPYKKTETNIDDTFPYRKTETNIDDTIPSKKTETNIDDTIPSKKTETNIDDTIPSKKTETNIDDTIPSKKTETNIDDTIPYKKIETNIDDTFPYRKTETNIDDTIPFEKFESNVNISVIPKLTPTNDGDTSTKNKAHNVKRVNMLNVDEGPVRTSSPKMGRAGSKESPFKPYLQKLGKSEETLLDIMPLEGQSPQIVAKSQEQIENTNDDCVKSPLSRSKSLGPHPVNRKKQKQFHTKPKETLIDDFLDSGSPGRECFQSPIAVLDKYVHTKPKETLIDDFLDSGSPGRECFQSPIAVLDKYNLMKHSEMMELSSTKRIFTPSIIWADPTIGDVMPPLPDTTDVPSVSDSEGQPTAEDYSRPPSSLRAASSRRLISASTDLSAPKQKWVPKQKQQRQRRRGNPDDEPENVASARGRTDKIRDKRRSVEDDSERFTGRHIQNKDMDPSESQSNIGRIENRNNMQARRNEEARTERGQKYRNETGRREDRRGNTTEKDGENEQRNSVNEDREERRNIINEDRTQKTDTRREKGYKHGKENEHSAADDETKIDNNSEQGKYNRYRASKIGDGNNNLWSIPNKSEDSDKVIEELKETIEDRKSRFAEKPELIGDLCERFEQSSVGRFDDVLSTASDLSLSRLKQQKVVVETENNYNNDESNEDMDRDMTERRGDRVMIKRDELENTRDERQKAIIDGREDTRSDDREETRRDKREKIKRDDSRRDDREEIRRDKREKIKRDDTRRDDREEIRDKREKIKRDDREDTRRDKREKIRDVEEDLRDEREVTRNEGEETKRDNIENKREETIRDDREETRRDNREKIRRDERADSRRDDRVATRRDEREKIRRDEREKIKRDERADSRRDDRVATRSEKIRDDREVTRDEREETRGNENGIRRDEKEYIRRYERDEMGRERKRSERYKEKEQHKHRHRIKSDYKENETSVNEEPRKVHMDDDTFDKSSESNRNVYQDTKKYIDNVTGQGSQTTEPNRHSYTRSDRSQNREEQLNQRVGGSDEHLKISPDTNVSEVTSERLKTSPDTNVSEVTATSGSQHLSTDPGKINEKGLSPIDVFLNSNRMDIDPESSPRLHRRRGGAIAYPDDRSKRKDKRQESGSVKSSSVGNSLEGSNHKLKTRREVRKHSESDSRKLQDEENIVIAKKSDSFRAKSAQESVHPSELVEEMHSAIRSDPSPVKYDAHLEKFEKPSSNIRSEKFEKPSSNNKSEKFENPSSNIVSEINSLNDQPSHFTHPHMRLSMKDQQSLERADQTILALPRSEVILDADSCLHREERSRSTEEKHTKDNMEKSEHQNKRDGRFSKVRRNIKETATDFSDTEKTEHIEESLNSSIFVNMSDDLATVQLSSTPQHGLANTDKKIEKKGSDRELHQKYPSRKEIKDEKEIHVLKDENGQVETRQRHRDIVNNRESSSSEEDENRKPDLDEDNRGKLSQREAVVKNRRLRDRCLPKRRTRSSSGEEAADDEGRRVGRGKKGDRTMPPKEVSKPVVKAVDEEQLHPPRRGRANVSQVHVSDDGGAGDEEQLHLPRRGRANVSQVHVSDGGGKNIDTRVEKGYKKTNFISVNRSRPAHDSDDRDISKSPMGAQEKQKYAGFIKRTGRGVSKSHPMKSVSLTDLGRDEEHQDEKLEEHQDEKHEQSITESKNSRLTVSASLEDTSSEDRTSDFDSVIHDNPIEMNMDDSSNEEKPASMRKGILNLFSCVGGRSSTTTGKAEKKHKKKRPTAYYEEGEKRKIKKISRQKDKKEKSLYYFEEPDKGHENSLGVKKSVGVSDDIYVDTNQEPLPTSVVRPSQLLPSIPTSERYHIRPSVQSTKLLAKYVDPAEALESLEGEVSSTDDDEDSSQRWKDRRLAHLRGKPTHSRSKERELSAFSSFGKANITAGNTKSVISKHKNTKYPGLDISSVTVDQSNSQQIARENSEESLDEQSDTENIDSSTEMKPVHFMLEDDLHVQAGNTFFLPRQSTSPEAMKSDITPDVPEIITDINSKPPDMMPEPTLGDFEEMPLPTFTEMTGFEEHLDTPYDAPPPAVPERSYSSDEYPSFRLNSSAPAHFSIGKQQISGQRHAFGPAHDQLDSFNESHQFDSSYDQSISFDTADLHQRRNQRTVSFDDGVHPLQRHISETSVGTESTTSRPRSASSVSNPLIYEPWRVKADKKKRSLSVGEMVYAKGVARPVRTRSVGEICNSTVASSVARRRAKARHSSDITSRMYQPRQHNRSHSLVNTSFGSVHPIRQRSFSGFDHSTRASDASLTAVTVKRSESDRQPSQSPQMQQLIEDKPKAPLKSDTLKSTDSASGGETLEERSSKEGSPTKEHLSPTKEKKKKKKFHIPSFSKKKSKDAKESAA